MKTNIYLLDTNYFLRLLIGDIPSQFRQAKKIFAAIENEKARGEVSILVINELLWILEHFYQQKRAKFLPLLLKLLALKNLKVIEVKKADLVWVLQQMQKRKLDFTDWYLVKQQVKHHWRLATFDKKLHRLVS